MARGAVYFWYRALLMLAMVSICTPAFAGTPGNSGNKPFLLSSISNTHPYVGQESILTYTLYFRDVAPKISNEENPSFRGILARESEPERYIKSMPAAVHGEQFRSAVVKQFRLAPVQKGMITITGYSMLCTLPQETISGGGSNPPDIRLRLTAPDIIISARALPEPVPEGFSGAIGSFQLDLLADKHNLRAGEPLSLKLVLSGTGSILTLKLPDLHLPESFRHNPPDIATMLNNESREHASVVTATVIAWPQSEGEFQIPAVRTVVFNPETGNFTTLLTKPFTIKVSTALQGTTFTDTASQSSNNGNKRPGSLLLLSIISLLLLLGGAALFIIRSKRQQQKQQSSAINSHERGHDVGKSAINLKQQLFSLLEERGVNGPGGLTRMELKDALQENGLPEEIRVEIPEVLDALDRQLYSPAGNKDSVIPDRIATKVSTLLNNMKNLSSSALKQAGKNTATNNSQQRKTS
jgi:hypothetical protein